MFSARFRTREAYRSIFPGWTPMNDPTHCSFMVGWVRKYAASVSRPAWMTIGGTPRSPVPASSNPLTSN